MSKYSASMFVDVGTPLSACIGPNSAKVLQKGMYLAQFCSDIQWCHFLTYDPWNWNHKNHILKYDVILWYDFGEKTAHLGSKLNLVPEIVCTD